MRFVEFTNTVSSAQPEILIGVRGADYRPAKWRDAAWVTAPVCEAAKGLADTTELYSSGQRFLGLLGFSEPFISSTGLAIDYVWVLDSGDATIPISIVVYPSRERLQEWADTHNRAVVYNRVKRYQLKLIHGRAIPRNFHEFDVPSGAKPGLTCMDIQPLARYAMACLQLLASETVTEVVNETPVPSRGDGRRSRTSQEPPMVIRSHGLVRKVRESLGTGRTATRRWWVRGHFRNQAYGPKLAYRRRIFIAPHTAGSATAPEPEQDTRPVVTVLRKEA